MKSFVNSTSAATLSSWEPTRVGKDSSLQKIQKEKLNSQLGLWQISPMLFRGILGGFGHIILQCQYYVQRKYFKTIFNFNSTKILKNHTTSTTIRPPPPPRCLPSLAFCGFNYRHNTVLAPWCTYENHPHSPARYHTFLIPWDYQERRSPGPQKFLSIAGPKTRKF